MKKIIAGILFFCIMAGTFSVSASQMNTDDIKADSQMENLLSMLDIMKGYPDGNFYPERSVTRAEFAKIAVAASSYRNAVSKVSQTSPFSDVPYTFWGASYIKVASANKLIKGYPDSTFRPEDNVKLEEAVTVVLKLLGYTDDDFGMSWPDGQMSQASKLDLLSGIDRSVGEDMLRGDVMLLVYNTLNTCVKNTQSKSIESFGYRILEDVTLIATTAEDPSVAQGKIVTSEGTYKITDDFDYDFVGKKGDMVIKNTNELVAFFPSTAEVLKYGVYTTLNNDIIVYEDNATKLLEIDENITAYLKSQKGTLKSFISSIGQGYEISVYLNYMAEPEYVIISDEKMVGPQVVSSNSWTNSMGPANVLRDGKPATIDKIALNDVVYYSKALKTIWAYSDKVTGIYEKAIPNTDSVKSITVSGISYELETVTAFNKLFSGGVFRLGDSVTLLLGKDGKVVDVLQPATASYSQHGYLAQTGVKEFEDSNGNTYTSDYVRITTAAGDELEYPAYKDYSGYLCKIVSVKMDNGKAKLSRVKNDGELKGTMRADKQKIGSFVLASNVKILDVMNTDVDKLPSCASVFPQRLDNMEFNSNSVLYYTKNNSGEVDNIYLNDMTGDGYEYGIVRKASGGGEMVLRGTYVCDIGGVEQTVSTSGKTFSVKEGDVAKFTVVNGKVDAMVAINKLENAIVGADEAYVYTSYGKKYPYSDKLIVYEWDSNRELRKISIDELKNRDKFNAKAYYDKNPEAGGRIRVLIVG